MTVDHAQLVLDLLRDLCAENGSDYYGLDAEHAVHTDGKHIIVSELDAIEVHGGMGFELGREVARFKLVDVGKRYRRVTGRMADLLLDGERRESNHLVNDRPFLGEFQDPKRTPAFMNLLAESAPGAIFYDAIEERFLVFDASVSDELIWIVPVSHYIR